MTDDSRARRRFVLFYAVPTFLVLLAVCAPLIRGLETFYLRDVLNAHLEMKWAQARAMQSGYFPLIDPYRAGGQPIAGNPNASPFYPTTLLFLVGSPFWALNVQFWLHWLLAPLAFFWMAREWGLSREGAWAGGVCYALSGFFVSHLSFYNLIAGVTLAPALVAACLRLARGGRRSWIAVAVAGLWALLAVSGDPLMALLAFGLAAAAVVVDGWGPHPPAPSPTSSLPPGEGEAERPVPSPRKWMGWRRLALMAGCFTAGTLLALPQLVEFLRILPLSFRGQKGYTPEVATLASWDPYQIAEWFLPMIFGRLDMLSLASFWGKKFFTGIPPYYVTLYPGLLTLALVLASGRPRGMRRVAAWWGWGAVVFGLFFSLGRFNPAAEWLFTLRGGALRYPVKLWLPVAVGAALLCGLGFQRLLGSQEGEEDPVTRRARRRFGLALLGLFLVLAGFWAFLTFQPGTAEELASRIIPESFQAKQPFVRNERLRWAGLCLFSFAVLAGLAVGARLLGRRPALGGAVLLAVHAVAQVLLLRPAYPTDPIQPYLIPPPALAYVPADVRVVNPDLNSLFGKHTLREGKFPERRGNWLERRAFYELYSFTGPQWRRRYDLNVSPEGLDSYLARMAQGAVRASNDEQRIRLLASWGVGRLVMNHPLTPETPGARQLAAIPSFGFHLYIYEVLNRAPEVFLARRAVFAPHLNAAYKTLSGATGGGGFDPRADVVLPGNGKPEPLGGGTVRIVRDGPEELELEVNAGAPGSVLVIQRSANLQKATVDGRPAEVLNANLQRVGVRVPAGRHRVRLWVDRRPFELSLGGTALGLLLLPVLFWWGRRSLDKPLL